MALVRPDVNSFAQIKVVGVGGAGGNVLNSMIDNQEVKGVDFIALNTDSQALLANKAPIKIQIGEKLTKGLGSGSNPEIGYKAAEESIEKIQETIGEADMVFITCGMGGGTGTGATPLIAQVARQAGALTVAVVTKPFIFEGSRRKVVAEDGIEELRDKVDTLIIIPNQRLLETIDKNMTLLDAFKLSDSILGEGVQGISDLITTPGLINVDFADVKTVMQNSGSALMGIGRAEGEDRAVKAARQAITSPLLEISIDGAKGILFNITSGKDITMQDVNAAAEIIGKNADPDANIIFGTTIDENLNNEVKITVIATGFDNMINNQYAQFTPTPKIQDLQEKPYSQTVDPVTLDKKEDKHKRSFFSKVLGGDRNDEEVPDKPSSVIPQKPTLRPIPSSNFSSQTLSSPSINQAQSLGNDNLDEVEKIEETEDEFDIPAFLRQKK